MESNVVPLDVTIELYSMKSGYKVTEIRRKIEAKQWLEGHEYHRNASGHVVIDVEGVSRWIEGQREPFAESQIQQAVQPAVAPKPVRRHIAATVPTALYRHFDAEGVLLYVGISLSPLARLSAHGDCSHWASKIASVKMQWFPDRGAALAAESLAIRSESPLHNIAGRARS